MTTNKKERKSNALGSLYKEQNTATKIVNVAKKTYYSANNSKKEYFSDCFDKTDSTLAYFFYNFLNGFNNTLPSFDYVYNIETSSNDDLISIGYGMSVHKGLLVESFQMVSDRKERLDRISKDDYTVSILGCSASYDYKSSGILESELHHRFKKERVALFKNYLRNYSNYKNHIKVKKIHK